MLYFKKILAVSFLVLGNKIIKATTPTTAQWNRIGAVALPFNTIGIDPHRHQFVFLCWIIKKLAVSFLVSHNKIVSGTISPIAQWDHLGPVAVGSEPNMIGNDP